MSQHLSPEEMAAKTHNLARFSVENPQLTWMFLLIVLVAGVFAYRGLPQRKDPDIPNKIASISCTWPGASPEKMDELVARKIDEALSLNKYVDKVKSMSRTGVLVTTVELDENFKGDTSPIFNDLNLKVAQVQLPEGAGPVQFNKDFGDTATLMLTVASPKASPLDLDLRSRVIQQQIDRVRAQAAPAAANGRATLVVCVPYSIPAAGLMRRVNLFVQYAADQHFGRDLRSFQSSGVVGVDGVLPRDDGAVRRFMHQFVRDKLQESTLHPDAWQPAIIRDPKETRDRLAAVAGDRYSYRDLDDFTDVMQRSLQTVPAVARVTRAGVLGQRVYLDYSQQRLASYGLQVSDLAKILNARNTTLPGGTLERGGRRLTLEPSGEFKSEAEIGNVLVSAGQGGGPVYLRDLVDIQRDYESPPTYLNMLTRRDDQGRFTTSRAITLALVMRAGYKIADMDKLVSARLDLLRTQLPRDLIIDRTSDEPRMVNDKVGLLMKSLVEAIILVVIVSVFGFMDWRPSVVLAICIPLTLGITFMAMSGMGLDIQQVSIASLIIALGLLVDVPVVACDAIAEYMAEGVPKRHAVWMGPTKLSTAMFYATLTNVVAYLPLLGLRGSTGLYIFSLPVVLALSLCSALLVSQGFVPLLANTLMRPKRGHAEAHDSAHAHGFLAVYSRLLGWMIDHRWLTFGISILLLLICAIPIRQIKTDFFPKDIAFLSYLDVWTPEDASLQTTQRAAEQAVAIVEKTAEEYGRHHADKDGKPRQILKSATAFLGGAGPRWWQSLVPEQSQLNYAMVVLEVYDGHDTSNLIGPWQQALDKELVGGRVDVRQLEMGKPVGVPNQYRIAGPEIPVLYQLSHQVEDMFRSTGIVQGVHNDWGASSFAVNLDVDTERANRAGVTNADVANSALAGISGKTLTILREGRFQIPVMARLRMEERGRLQDIENLYVYSAQGDQKVPLAGIARLQYGVEPTKIRRWNYSRTIIPMATPSEGKLASEVTKAMKDKIEAWEKQLPPGYKMDIGGLAEEQKKSFADLLKALFLTISAIYIALAFQFKNPVKPLIVFAALPYGMTGGFIGLWLGGAAFGTMAFLSFVSLVGVIVSHVIVLFDFIEEMHAKGEPLRTALIDAGIARLRPVVVTVTATVLGLIPLAMHGGPLWTGLCYVQMGGLTVATIGTLALVPVLYTIAVKDLKLVQWDVKKSHEPEEAHPPAPTRAAVG
jgi:multidrug efflux pump subunit AcrB